MRSRLSKSVLAILLILSMVIPNIALNANAEDAATDTPIDNHTVEWETFNDASVVKAHLDNDSVPTKTGYLFAGWYTQQTNDMDSLKQYALRNAQPNGATYALFVPEDVLGVKAQVSAHLVDGQYTDADNSASIRFITSIPSLAFKEVGLVVTYIGKDGTTEYTSESEGNTVYQSLYQVDDDEIREEKPWTLLCGASKYFKAHTITGVPYTHYTTEFHVRPYWVTLEDDKVWAAEPVTKRIDEINSGFGDDIFKDSTTWNLINQHNGVVSIPAGTTANWLQLDQPYKDIDITVKAKDDGLGTGNARTDVFFVFDVDGTKKNLSIGVQWNGSAYRINADANADSATYGTPIFNQYTMYGNGTLLGAEGNAFRKNNPVGIDFRVVRIGTDICIYVNERLVDMLPLTGVTAETEATVYIRHTGDTNIERVIPFAVSEPVDNFQVKAHGYNHSTSYAGQSQVAASNLTDMDLTVLAKRDTNLEATEMYDVMLDFDLGEGVTKNVSFCFRTFEDAEQTDSLHKGKWAVSNFNITGTNSDSRVIFKRQHIVYGDKNFSPGDTTPEEFTMFTAGSRSRLDFRIKRVGTTIDIYLAGKLLATADVSTDYNGASTGITEDTPVKVTVRHYGQKKSTASSGQFTYRYLLITP